MNRLGDILLVVLSAPLWLPVLMVVAMVSWLVQGSPVLFRDERAGWHGRAFVMFKFRTMRQGSETDSVRLTRFGSFLRKTSLDELPELWNVLKGDMALVGPRPLPTRYLPRYSPEQNRRHEVRPGLTGWAQVNGRNALDWDEKFRFDVDYVDSRSLTLDLKIIGMTILQLVRPRGIVHAGTVSMPEFTGGKGE